MIQECLSVVTIIDFHAVESAMVHTIRTDAGADIPDGLLPSFLSHEHHFLCRDLHHDAYAKNADPSDPSVTHIRADYGEAFNVPVGPEEAQDYWFGLGHQLRI